MPLHQISEVIDDYTGNARAVLEYALTTEHIVDSAKRPGFAADSWAPLAALVAVEEFVRVGNFKEVMTWDEYIAFLTGWAPTADWDCSFKRVTETPGLVFLELEERSTTGDYKAVVNSVSVYEFTATGKIRHIDVYLQMAMPSPEILKTYEGIDIAE
ncbi:hypothetical protein ACFQ07_33200 [Actinomadura adrarensis]|uniref:SnoaL-like domain-containing protein n=1 Tax=Actinomadura adrarensis TaxID=1819600 RepID=A0ABW3CT35_9ACTN